MNVNILIFRSRLSVPALVVAAEGESLFVVLVTPLARRRPDSIRRTGNCLRAEERIIFVSCARGSQLANSEEGKLIVTCIA